MNETYHIAYNRARYVAVAIGVLALICFKLANAHVVDVELCLREVLELEAKSDKIERDKEGNEACDRVNNGSTNERDVERSVEHIRETTH